MNNIACVRNFSFSLNALSDDRYSITTYLLSFLFPGPTSTSLSRLPPYEYSSFSYSAYTTQSGLTEELYYRWGYPILNSLQGYIECQTDTVSLAISTPNLMVHEDIEGVLF